MAPIDVIDHPASPRPALPAATVVLARDGDGGIEVLLIHRGSGTAFGGMWAFPGGVIEDGDVPAGGGRDPLPAARRAAVREAAEEVGLQIEETSLVFWSHWLPPAVAPRRFSTWFFVAPAVDHHEHVGVDGVEVADHRWITVSDALAAQASGEISLAAPTFVTLAQLAAHADVAELLAAASPVHFATRMARDGGGRPLCLFAGDIGYDDGDLDADGPHHRVLMGDAGGWRYVNTTAV